jgi:hypothetical protein
MLQELDVILLTEDLPDAGLKIGDKGCAVLVHPDGGCEAEFVATSGETLALVTLSPAQFRVPEQGWRVRAGNQPDPARRRADSRTP